MSSNYKNYKLPAYDCLVEAVKSKESVKMLKYLIEKQGLYVNSCSSHWNEETALKVAAQDKRYYDAFLYLLSIPNLSLYEMDKGYIDESYKSILKDYKARPRKYQNPNMKIRSLETLPDDSLDNIARDAIIVDDVKTLKSVLEAGANPNGIFDSSYNGRDYMCRASDKARDVLLNYGNSGRCRMWGHDRECGYVESVEKKVEDYCKKYQKEHLFEIVATVSRVKAQKILRQRKILEKEKADELAQKRQAIEARKKAMQQRIESKRNNACRQTVIKEMKSMPTKLLRQKYVKEMRKMFTRALGLQKE